MNVVVEQLPNCLATLKVEVEPEKVSSARKELVEEFGKAARIPGFRPGKAPRAAIEKRFKKQIQEELEKKLVQDGAREAIKSKGLKVLQVASVDEVEIPELEGSSASFTATVVTQPDFELPNYKGIVVAMRPTEVTDEEIENSLEQLRDQAADFVDIADDRGAQMEDYVIVDYHGAIDGQPVHELFPKAGKPLTANEDFWIKMTDEAFFPGFCAALLDAKPGDTREFDVTVPSDFPVEGMPGQTIHYNVTVKAIKTKTLPPLDDAFADTVSKGKTLAEVRELARDEISRQKKTDAEAAKRADIMREILSKVECELPTSLVRSHTQSIINDIVRENTARGVAEEILKENEKDIVASAAANARERLKGTFVLMRIAEKEGIRVSQEELLGRVAAMAQRYQMTFEKMLKELRSRNGLDQIHEEMLTAKALDFLVSNASVTTAPVATAAAS
jgi:trigger factor